MDTERPVQANGDDATEQRARRWRTLQMLRAGLGFAGIASCWVALGVFWGPGIGLAGFFGTLAAIGLALVSLLFVASLRFPRLRRALLPFECGIVVAGVMLLLGTSGYEVDTTSDHVALAVMFGFGTALVVSFVAQLVDGRRSAPSWIAGTVVLAAVLGVAVPKALDWVDQCPGCGQSGMADPHGMFMSQIVDGGVRLSDAHGASLQVASAGYLDDPYAAATMHSYDVAMIAGDPSAVATVPAPQHPGGVPHAASVQLQLVARLGGKIELRVPAKLADGGQPVIVTLRRGSCAKRSAPSVGRWTVQPGRPLVANVPIALSALTLRDQLSVVAGTGGALDPVNCADMLSPLGLAFARAGAIEFERDCLRPLDLAAPDRSSVTPATFQEPACAGQLEELSQLAFGTFTTTDRIAPIRACLERERSLEFREVGLGGGDVVVVPLGEPTPHVGMCLADLP